MRYFPTQLVFVYIIGLLSFSACRSTKNQHISTIAKEDTRLANALLWKIEGNGLKSNSYLFGTIHMIDSKDYFLPNGLLSAIESIDKMYFEIDVNDMTDMSKIMGLMQQVMMSDNLSLKDLVTAEEYQLISNHFDKMGIPLMFMERMKPMFLEAFAGGDINPTDLQSGKLKSYEMELNDLAKQTNKPVAGLESIEFQLSVFDSIPYKIQAKMLVDAIKSGSQGGNELAELVKIYKAMDIEAMVTMIGEDEGGLSKYQDILLDNRNKNWIPIMSDAMSTQSCLFAVGAGHLAGNYGVIRLLRKENYTVTPILK